MHPEVNPCPVPLLPHPGLCHGHFPCLVAWSLSSIWKPELSANGSKPFSRSQPTQGQGQSPCHILTCFFMFLNFSLPSPHRAVTKLVTWLSLKTLSCGPVSVPLHLLLPFAWNLPPEIQTNLSLPLFCQMCSQRDISWWFYQHWSSFPPTPSLIFLPCPSWSTY
jgi:hypothetical protein